MSTERGVLKGVYICILRFELGEVEIIPMLVSPKWEKLITHNNKCAGIV
jgi:hypothetical protein